MASTTIKLSIETRDRLKSLGGATYEDTIVEALDALEAERFWTQADKAHAWRRTLSGEELAHRSAQDADIDQAFDGL